MVININKMSFKTISRVTYVRKKFNGQSEAIYNRTMQAKYS